MKKTLAAKERFLSVNPKIEIETYDEYFDENSKIDIKKYDYIVDAIDSVSSKIYLAEKAEKEGLLWRKGLENCPCHSSHTKI